MKSIHQAKNCDWKTIIGGVLVVTLVLSIVYLLFKMIVSPIGATEIGSYQYLRNEYILALILGILGSIVIIIPSVIEKKLHFSITNYIILLFLLFLYCAIFLGEIKRLYVTIPQWDTVVHVFSSGIIGVLGFQLVNSLNVNIKVNIKLSPVFIALFAFCFSFTLGAIWEIFEYVFDGMFLLNMQKYMLEDGTQLMGHTALKNTMEDIMINGLGAIIVSIIGYATIRKKIKCQNKIGEVK